MCLCGGGGVGGGGGVKLGVACVCGGESMFECEVGLVTGTSTWLSVALRPQKP